MIYDIAMFKSYAKENLKVFGGDFDPFKLQVQQVKVRGGSGVKKTGMAYIKVQPVMESLLFTELQNLPLWRKYDASKFGGIGHSHTK